MSAGRRDKLVTLQRATALDDGYTEALSWDNPTKLGEEWAAVFYGAGAERRQAAMEQGSQAATFEMLGNASTRALTLKDRISFDGVAWDITNIAPDTPRRGEIAITATRSA